MPATRPGISRDSSKTKTEIVRCLKRNITREAYPLITCPGNDSGQTLRC